MNRPSTWGFDAFFASQPSLPDTEPARVIERERLSWRVVTTRGERDAELTGRLRADPGACPVVGDWVHLRLRKGEARGEIHGVYERRTALGRKGAGRETTRQVLAANVDVVALVTAANRELSFRRTERWLAAAWASGAQPAVILNKADLHGDAEALAGRLEAVAIGVDVHVASALTGAGVGAIRERLARDRTVVLVGSSGVGKSTLVNAILGREAQETREVREDDDRGRHTTTRRNAFLVPGGGVLIDTPGLRELALWGADGIASTFPEIEALADGCRFRDCAHEGEPGCAVRAAVEDGALEAGRVGSWEKLRREAAWLEQKVDERARVDAKRERKRFAKAIRSRAVGDLKREHRR